MVINAHDMLFGEMNFIYSGEGEREAEKERVMIETVLFNKYVITFISDYVSGWGSGV